MFNPGKKSFEAEYDECASHCPPAKFVCVAKCSDDYDENLSKCPCQSKCPSGCPCPEYECESERTDVLILSTHPDSKNLPIMTNSAAREDEDFFFELDEKAEVYKSCSLTWQNELHVFGGKSEKTQISKVTSCRLEPIGKLAFNHYYGDCVNVADNKVILCFNNENGDYNKCRMASSPTGAFSEMALSQYHHRITRIATDDGEFMKLPNKNKLCRFNSEFIIAVGSQGVNNESINKKTELLDVNGNSWSDADEYTLDWGLTEFFCTFEFFRRSSI